MHNFSITLCIIVFLLRLSYCFDYCLDLTGREGALAWIVTECGKSVGEVGICADGLLEMPPCCH